MPRQLGSGRQQLLVVALAAMLAGLLLTDWPRYGPSDSDIRAQRCAQSRQSAESFPLELRPMFAPAGLDELQRKCGIALPVTYGAAPPVPPTPGCHLLDPVPDGRLRPRTQAPPRRSIPYFAQRSGTLPPSGTPNVAGVQLPRGSRCGPFWATDAGVQEAFYLASSLASRFESTGLWPILWASWDEPDFYVHGRSDVAEVAKLDAARVLRRERLAPAQEHRPGFNPFNLALAYSLLELPPRGGFSLLLVPVNRPADVFSVLNMAMTVYYSDEELSAIARSWEERFGATLTVLAPGFAQFEVIAPPAHARQARLLAAEFARVVPDDGQVDDLGALAQQLRSDYRRRGITWARNWTLGWPD